MKHICGIRRLLALDIRLAMGVTRYWIGHMPARRQPLLILLFIGTVTASVINCYFMAWRIVQRNGGPPPWLIKPMFSYFNHGVVDREYEFVVASRNYNIMVKNKRGLFKWLKRKLFYSMKSVIRLAKDQMPTSKSWKYATGRIGYLKRRSNPKA